MTKGWSPDSAGKIITLLPDMFIPAGEKISPGIKNSNGTTTDIRQFLLKVKNYQGASGVISFDENGDVKKPIIIKKIEGGKFVKVL